MALHAACAKVAHYSGAGEYAGSVLREMEDSPVLSNDGPSAAILEHAIWAAQCKFNALSMDYSTNSELQIMFG